MAAIRMGNRRRRHGWRRSVLWLGLFAVALWGGGFLWFVTGLNQTPLHEPDRAVDGIVVLTGGAGRISTGLDLVAAGRGERMLISGVDLTVDRATLERQFGADRTRLFECCVDIGRVALDTRGNAAEAADWARQRGFASLMIVTARDHMPRSLLEFRHLIPDIQIKAYSVSDHAGLSRLAREYSKYLIRLIDIRLT